MLDIADGVLLLLLQLGAALLQTGIQVIEPIVQHLHAPFEPRPLGARLLLVQQFGKLELYAVDDGV
jgi:hypothetical protein